MVEIAGRRGLDRHRRGLDRWKDGVITPAHKDGSTDQVLSLAEDRDGSLWVGTYSTGLQHWINGAPAEAIGTRRRLAGQPGARAGADPRRHAVDRHVHAAWRAARTARCRFTAATTACRANSSWPCTRPATAALWIGTANGLAYFQDGKVTAVDVSQLDDAQDVFGIHEDADGTLWFATDRGLLRRKAGKMSILGVTSGLPVTTVFQVVDRQLRQLLADLELRRDLCPPRRMPTPCSTAAARRLDYQQFAEADGMASAQCNGGAGPAALRARDGAIWVATAKGVAIVQPDQLARYQLAPPAVVIEGIRVDGQESVNKDALILPPGTKQAGTRLRQPELPHAGADPLSLPPRRLRQQLGRAQPAA